MKLGKMILTVVGATVLLGALASATSARNFSLSSQTNTTLWRRMDFAGGLGGTIECEVLVAGSLHSRTNAKTVGLLIGYITSATVLRCARGGATVNQGSLPWHRRYRSFTGALPNITSQSETITGAEWTLRDPFGTTCTVAGATSSMIGTYTIGAGGVITRADRSGAIVCASGGFSFTVSVSGSETNVAERLSGARTTLTLI